MIRSRGDKMDAQHHEEHRSPNTPRKEQRFIHLKITDHKNVVMVIKLWSIVLGASAIVFAFMNETNAVFLLGALSAFFFWYFDALNTVFQTALKERSIELEPMVRGEIEYDGGKNAEYFKQMSGLSEPFRAVSMMLKHTNVNIPHGPVAVACLILYYGNASL